MAQMTCKNAAHAFASFCANEEVIGRKDYNSSYLATTNHTA